MITSIFKHISRTFFDIYNAYRAAYPTYPTFLFKAFAAQFELQSEIQNRIARDFFDPKTREAAYGFASRCDYEPLEADGCTVTLTITLTGAMAKTLPIGYQVGGISAITGDMVIFELTEEGDSEGTDEITVAAKQKVTFSDVSLGLIANADDFADYPIDGYSGIIKSSASIEINSVGWTRVNNFDSSIDTDTDFVLLYQSNGKARVQFGDGVTGVKPAVGQEILGTFETTKGTLGRMEADLININVGGDTDISAVTNASATSGGNDSESVASIVRNSRANVRLRNIIWSQEDLEFAALQASASVVKALGIPGVGTAIIHIIPAGGGAPSSPLKDEVEDYVTALTQFGAMPITIEDPNYTTVNIAATVTIRSGFTAGTVRDLVEFGLTLVSCAFDSEIMEYYDDNGIDACREDKINSIWSWAFTSDENDALTYIIEKWREMLGDRVSREWEQDLEVGDLWIMGNSLYTYGVDNFSLTTPTTNQTPPSLYIINTGTCAVT